MLRLEHQIERMLRWDEAVCLRMNRGLRLRWLRLPLQAASRLGDGVFWYSLLAALLALHGREAAGQILHILLTGAVCSLIYKWLKARTLRPRPYQVLQAIRAGAAPLDRFSFPSGHTLHAVAFSVMTSAWFPETAWVVWPFTFLVALSRPVLGLHYPSDVLAGAAVGAAIAALSLPL
ncbi:MAG TPA: phosphatase PAP2 family protein [Burkholderiales bacterium]|nr:phosphatase PAP2 family protein [Burkholderiales bacterium]